MVGLCRHSRKEVDMTALIPRTPISTPYKASADIELEHRLANFLYQRQVPDVDCVRLDARGGVIAVSGSLTSPHIKWLCMECCRRVAGVVTIIDELELAPAIVKFPGAVQKAAEPKRYKQPRRNSTGCRGNHPFHHDAISEHAAHRAAATSQQSRLLAAA
jgi:hypothetical protein